MRGVLRGVGDWTVKVDGGVEDGIIGTDGDADAIDETEPADVTESSAVPVEVGEAM